MEFERIFQIHRHGVGMMWGNRFRPLFLLKCRRAAEMINNERLGWILNVLFKSTPIVWVWCGGSVPTPIFVKISEGGWNDQY